MNWQPIETAPKDEHNLLGNCREVFLGAWHSSTDYYLKSGWYPVEEEYKFDNARDYCGIHAVMEIHPTHWMPLPDPPQA